MKINEIISALEKNGVRCSIVGGCAVALHGIVRGTIDLDLIIEHTAEQFQRCESALKTLGFVSRLPVTAHEVFQFRHEYISNRHLLTWSFYRPNQPLDVVDILITDDLRQLKSVRIKSGTFSYPVLSLKDLIQMKKRAGRPQDIEDLKHLEEMHHAQENEKS
jgi:predicted nucleotidyltransferase